MAVAVWWPRICKCLAFCLQTLAKHLQQAGASFSPALVEKQHTRFMQGSVHAACLPFGVGDPDLAEGGAALPCWSPQHPQLSRAASGMAQHGRDTKCHAQGPLEAQWKIWNSSTVVQ